MHLKEKAALLPEKPGVYMMKDRTGRIIYVGKASVLRNRVRSYFTGTHDAKTQKLVQQIDDFETIVTSSASEALLLECNLIKKHSPRYNVLLKDDKSYPYIKLTNETHPRLEVTRKVKKDGGHYFGPYANAGAANETKKLLDRLYPLRKCRTIPDRVCLYYHLGQCLAPCEYDVHSSEYSEMVEDITRLLNGRHHEIVTDLKQQMEAAAAQLNFERAKELRDLIAHIQHVMEKQHIHMQDKTNRDVFGFYADKGWMCIQVFFVRQGKLLERDVTIFPLYQKDVNEALLSFIGQFYVDREQLLPREILLPPAVDQSVLQEWLTKTTFTIPKRGKKKELVEMATSNARHSLEEKFQLMERNEERTIRAVERLGRIFGTGTVHRIEAFDNSNIQGTNPVSAMVVFEDGRPLKSAYRKYKIQSVEGPDDYASMREVIYRRYARLLKENQPLPDLIVVDGGKGQMMAAQDVLENELGLYVPVCGLAKDEKHRSSEVLFGNPPQSVAIDRSSHEFYLLQRIQDEVHRFAIQFHRRSRSVSMIHSVLDDIPGIGPKRKQLLMRHFGSVKKLRESSVDELQKLGIGKSLAERIVEHLRQKRNDGSHQKY